MLQEMRQWLRDTRLRRRVDRIIIPALADLDRLYPNWYLYVTRPVILTSPTDCVMGQIYGHWESQPETARAVSDQHSSAFDPDMTGAATDALLLQALEQRWARIARVRREDRNWHSSTPTY